METFGRYQLQEKLGQGGMGVVYRAFDTVLERTVALKLLLPAETDAQLRERLFREARSAGNLKHKNVVTIYDLGEHEGRPYLAMELLEGEDLQRRLSRPEKMSLRHKVDLAIDICDGLAHAHAHGVVHRDIKPANIFITDGGGAKLLDFGLARLMASQLTRSNMLMGTLNYMAPEQVRGERADHRSDIFSTGVVLYELFGGRKAFEGDSVASTLYKILQEVPEPLSKIDAALPHELASITECMLAKLPDERYPTIDAARRDLETYRANGRVGPVTPLPSPIPPLVEAAHTMPVSGSAPIVSGDEPRPVGAVSPHRLWLRAAVAVAAVVAIAAAAMWTLDRRSTPPAPIVSTPAPQARSDEASAAPVRDANALPIRTEASREVLGNPRWENPAVERPPEPRPALRSRTPQPPAHVSAPAASVPPTTSAVTTHNDHPPSAADIAPAVPATAGPPPAALGTAAVHAIPEPPTSMMAAMPPSETTSAAVAEQRVTELLDRYKQALESRNIDQLKRIWPSLGAGEEAAIRQEFQHASRIVVAIDRPEVVAAGSAWRVSFIRNYSLLTVDGQRLRSTTPAVMDVRRNGNAWVIEAIRFAER